jgi:hypothetical protein
MGRVLLLPVAAAAALVCSTARWSRLARILRCISATMAHMFCWQSRQRWVASCCSSHSSHGGGRTLVSPPLLAAAIEAEKWVCEKHWFHKFLDRNSHKSSHSSSHKHSLRQPYQIYQIRQHCHFCHPIFFLQIFGGF